jgi:hypothetical protein
MTAREAAFFLASVSASGSEPPLFRVDDERKLRSDRQPPRADGTERGFNFFEAPGRLRLETIVHMAAMARLRDEFGWPREHLVFESPIVVEDDRVLLRNEALDMLLREEPCTTLAATMPLTAARSQVGVESKADSKLLGRLLDRLRSCPGTSPPCAPTDHQKCLAIATLRPRLFLGVAAGETWRLFSVAEDQGRAVLGEELSSLDQLRFGASA